MVCSYSVLCAVRSGVLLSHLNVVFMYLLIKAIAGIVACLTRIVSNSIQNKLHCILFRCIRKIVVD